MSDVLDHAHHALGRPDGPHVTPYRNYFATDADSAEARAFAASPYWDAGRGVPGGLTYFHVTDTGIRAVWDWLRGRQKARGVRPYVVTVYWSYCDDPSVYRVVAKSRSAARFDAYRQMSDSWCDLTFRQFCGFRISVRAQ